MNNLNVQNIGLKIFHTIICCPRNLIVMNYFWVFRLIQVKSAQKEENER